MSGEELYQETRLHSLMVAAQKGDTESYRALLESLSVLLHQFYGRKLGNFRNVGSSMIEDLSQETLLAIHSKRHTFDPKQKFTPWFYAIARFKFVDLLRRDWRLVRGEAADQVIALQEAPQSNSDSLLEDSLSRALDELPLKQKQVIELVKVLGFSVEEAAHKTGFSASDVKVSVHRGLKALRKKLEATDG